MCIFKKKKQQSTITLWSVTNQVSIDKNFKMLTVSPTEQGCVEFVRKSMKAEHLSHYTVWCSLRNMNIDSDDSWKLYEQTVITEEDLKKYIINKLVYSISDIATIMRIMNGCNPIGCSYEDDLLEHPERLKKIYNEVFNEIKIEKDKNNPCV